MKDMIDKAAAKTPAPAAPQADRPPQRKTRPNTLADILHLPGAFNISNGRFVFIDRLQRKTHVITLEDINAEISAKFNDYYTGIVSVASTGSALLNGEKGQTVRWTSSFYPMAAKLTMSNRFEVSNLDMLTFEPYYDRYSPFVFKSGRFGGLLIFDFDNGSIGSSNEVHLSDLEFLVKGGYENAEFWGSTVKDLVKYFTSPYGDIVFDFKIKGEMSAPRFYLGPISKQALTAMAVDKISEAIQQASGKEGSVKNADLKKAGEYIDIVRGILKKR
jgi:hypothetical protein